MANYLGPLGGLVRIPCVSSIQASREPRYRTSVTVEGQARTQQLWSPLPRSWSVTADVEAPGALDLVESFALGLYGRGPFVWVPDDAAALNVLTPAQSALVRPGNSAYQPAGPVTVQGQSFPASLSVSIPTAWAPLYDYVPVHPSHPVTVSMWAQAAGGTPQLTVAQRTGDSLGDTRTVAGTSGGMWQRLTASFTPGAGVDSIRIGARAGTTAVAGVQVTWTPGPVQWALGRGASSVVIEQAQSTPIWLPGPYSDGQWTVREVGDAGW